MKICILGAGSLGVALGRRLTVAGHELRLSFSRSPDKLALAGRSAGAVEVGAPDMMAGASNLIVMATPWMATLDAARSIATVTSGKIVWDATNALKPDLSGLAIGTTTSGGEELARVLPDARVVKAIPPMAELLASDSLDIGGRQPGVFVCGDDAPARATVLRLIGDIGAEGVDAGQLTLARYTEPLGMLLVQLAYVQGLGPRIGSVLIRDAAPTPHGATENAGA